MTLLVAIVAAALPTPAAERRPTGPGSTAVATDTRRQSHTGQRLERLLRNHRPLSGRRAPRRYGTCALAP